MVAEKAFLNPINILRLTEIDASELIGNDDNAMVSQLRGVVLSPHSTSVVKLVIHVVFFR